MSDKPVGIPSQFEPTKPGLVQRRLLAEAVPEKEADPVQRPPPTLGNDTVNVPLKLLAVTWPVSVPFQSRETLAYVPVIFEVAWFKSINTESSPNEDPILPIQWPAIDATGGGLGAVGVLSPPHAVHTTTINATTYRLIQSSPLRACPRATA
jgi:hypothetical protein